MKLKLYTLFIVCLLFVGCNHDNESSSYSPSLVNVAFSVGLPVPEEVQTGGITRAYTDSDIKNITLLVFDNNKKFQERIDIDESELTVAGGSIKFITRLNATPDNRTIHMIANARTADGATDRIDFTGLVVGDTESTIISALKTNNITGTGEDLLLNNIMPLVMWGRADLPNISIASKVDGVKLLRAVSCIRVKKQAISALDHLEVLGITVHEGAHMGHVAPAGYLAEAVIPNSPNALPIQTYLDANYCWSMGATPSMYVYEHSVAASQKGLSLIIKAKHRTKECYYKVVLANGTNQLDMIRNHRYTLTIIKADEKGYDDLQTAITSSASNIKFEITDDDEDYPFIQADSEHWIGVSHNYLDVYGTTAGNPLVSSEIELCTVFTSRGVTPVCEIESSGNWLISPKVELIQNETNKYRVTVESLADVSNPLPELGASIVIRCNNLSHAINARWTKQIPMDNSDANGYVFDLLTGGPVNYKAWTASIPDPVASTNVRLHPTSATPSPADGLVTSLTSKYASNAYLHINKSPNRIDEVRMSYASSSGNGTTVSRIIIAQ